MNRLLALPCFAALAAAAAAQPPRATNSLEFHGGGTIEVSYNQLDLAKGATLKSLTAEGEEGDAVRQRFNERGFKRQIDGKLVLGATTDVAGSELDPGTYVLSFRIDDDRIWYLVVLSESDEEIFSVALDVEEDERAAASRLVIRPLAADNAKRTGHLEIRFGNLASQVSFRAHDEDDDDEENP